MEAVLKAEEKLEKKAESASMSSSTSTAPSSDHSAKSSPVDPSDLICMIIEKFVSEVKTAMQSSICKVASYKTSQWSKDWKMTCSRVTQEMMNILEAKIPPFHLEDTSDLRKAQETTEPDTDTVTIKVIMVVLDVLNGSSADGRADYKTTDLLIAAAEKLNQMATSSNLEERLIVRHKPREELQTKATRAVSQILLISTGVLEKSIRSPKIPSSLTSETNLDSMLEAMAEAGFPTDLLQSHLDSTSRDIVDTISGNMEMLSVTCPSSEKRKDLHDLSDAAKDTINHVFQGVNEKVKRFYSVFKQLVKTRDTQDNQSTEPSSSVSETETLVTKFSHSAESQSACLHPVDLNDLTIFGPQKIDDVMSSNSVPVLNQPEGDTSTVTYERFLHKAIQVDSDVLLESATQNYSCCTSSQTHSFTGSRSTSTTLISSSSDLHGAAVAADDVARIVVDALDRLAESSMIDGKSDSDTIIRSLNACRSDISVVGSRSVPLNLFERVRGYLQTLFMTYYQSQPVSSTQRVPTSYVQLSRVHSVSHLDDLTVTCTNSIISEIVQLYHSDTECQAPVGDKDSLEIHDIFQGLGELVRTSKSSSKTSSSGKDLRECEEMSLPKLDPAFKVDPAPDRTSSHRSLETLLCARFQNKAVQTVGEILLKTGEKLSASGSTQSFKSVSSSATIQPTVVDPGFFIQASEIFGNFLSCLRQGIMSIQSDSADTSKRPTSERKKKVSSASRRIYRSVHEKVFGFMLGLQMSFSERWKVSPQDQPTTSTEQQSGSVLSVSSPPHITSPRFQLFLDSCTEDVIYKVVELYKSELLLSSSSKVSLNISTSLPEQPLLNLKTTKPKSFLTDAAQLVSDVLIRRSSQMSSDEPGHVLDSSREICSLPLFSASSADVHDAAVTNAETVVDALDRRVDSKHSAMITDMLSCLDDASHISATSIAEVPDTSERISQSNSFIMFRKIKYLLTSLSASCSSAVPERSTEHEDGISFEKSGSAAEIEVVALSQSLQQKDSEMKLLLSDETIGFHAERLTNFTSDILRHFTGPAQVWRRSSDSVLETPWVRNNVLRDPIQVPPSLIHAFLEDSVKILFLHLLSLKSATHHRADLSAPFTASNQAVKGNSAGFDSQNNISEESLHPAIITGEMQDVQSLLVNSEQTESQRNDDMLPIDFDSPVAPPTTSSWVGSATMRETLENPKNSTNDYETQSSSSSPVNESYSSDPVTVAEKKSRRGFRLIVDKKAPLIRIGLKKLSKVCPADTMSDSHQCASSSEDHQLSSQRESTLKPFPKTRKCLSRIFAAVRKALPNPFQCISQSS
ncbi:hypothetical protein MHYP_G00098080 [Metynnis hypsauchen]